MRRRSVSRNPRAVYVKKRISKAKPNLVEVGPLMTFEQAMNSVRDLTAKDARLPLQTPRSFTELIEQRGIYGVIRLLVEWADDRAYETQDVDDDLIWHVLELTEKQLRGLMLSKSNKAMI